MFAVLLFMVLMGTYVFVEQSRIKTFFNKLDDRALTVAQFYLAEDNLSKENFKDVLKKFPQSLSDEYIRIYDDKFQPKFIRESSVKWDINILQRVIAGKRLHFSQGDRQVSGIYYRDNSGNFIIMVSAIDLNGYNDMHQLRIIMLFLFSVSLLVTFFIGRIFSRFALSPIVNITSNLKRIRASSLDLRLPLGKNKTDEIDNLSLTINQLLEHLEQSFENQQSFISNASHELRTPITIILGEAETTIMRERKSGEYQQALINIIKETERLHYIINSLMELMQTSTDNLSFQNIRIDELLWEIIDELLIKTNENQGHIQYKAPVDRSKYTLFGNRQLLVIGISNIIKNAIKFSGGKDVYCELFNDVKGINIVIRDQGIGIAQKDLQRIFQPFFRAPNALKYSGSGIGLSLTQNIVRLHNGIIEIESEIGKGTEFRIILPASI